MALTSPDSRCRVSDPAKHAFAAEEAAEATPEDVDEYPDAEYFKEPYSPAEIQVFNSISAVVEVPEQVKSVAPLYTVKDNFDPTNYNTCIICNVM